MAGPEDPEIRVRSRSKKRRCARARLLAPPRVPRLAPLTSMMIASPWPPPEQIAAQPRPPPRRRSSWTSAPTIRAPEAPIGWPSAIAPPLTLTLSSSTPSIRTEFRATEANASLISQRSISSADLPSLSSACWAAFAGVLRQVGEVVGDGAVGEHPRQHLAAVGLRPLVGGDDHRGGAVVDAGGVARGVGGVVAADRGQLRERLDGRVGADRLVGLDDVLGLAALDRDRDDLLGELALVRRLRGELMGAGRPAVHVGAGDLELVADLAAPR